MENLKQKHQGAKIKITPDTFEQAGARELTILPPKFTEKNLKNKDKPQSRVIVDSPKTNAKLTMVTPAAESSHSIVASTPKPKSSKKMDSGSSKVSSSLRQMTSTQGSADEEDVM